MTIFYNGGGPISGTLLALQPQHRLVLRGASWMLIHVHAADKVLSHID